MSEKELIYDIDEAVEFIEKEVTGVYGDTEAIIRRILELDEEYMRSVGIIDEE